MSRKLRAFICYRRSDSFMHLGAPEGAGPDFTFIKSIKSIFLKLGFDSVFLDVERIQVYADYDSSSFKAIEDCDLFIAVVGNEWMSLLDRRISAGTPDAVVQEIRTALRYEKPILPILVDGAIMPAAERLPTTITRFHFANAKSISVNDTLESIQQIVAEPVRSIRKMATVGERCRRAYGAVSIIAYILCAILPNIVGWHEYGEESWLSMAKIWGGLFIWPIFFSPLCWVPCIDH